MTVRKPEFGDPELGFRIRADAAAYLTSGEDNGAQQAERQQRANQLAAEVEKAQEQAEAPAAPPLEKKSRKQRSKWTKAAE